MAGTVVADTLQADSTSTLVIKNGVANTPPTIQDSAGTQIGTFCRAWVNFNGTTVTNPASMTGVRASFNVSSILDNGTGDYTVNFTTAIADANYAVVLGVKNDNSRGGSLQISGTPTTTAVQLVNREWNGTAFVSADATYANAAIFR